ncbi:hypothetical protein BC834DRAFT_967140 [Gloeopeniophorella convolvens]|nr:hypothetical protein BC834DRAFT_967140 [Gloeopeniophorella convolvens]
MSPSAASASATQEPGETLPAAAFETLLPKLLAVVEITQRSEGTSSVQNKQDLLQAIQTFRESLAHAREIAQALPGGELLVEEQDEVIAMLERLRAKKRQQLREFAERAIDTQGHVGAPYVGAGAQSSARMEVDSNASTPT